MQIYLEYYKSVFVDHVALEMYFLEFEFIYIL
jgi:hypothetical protein